CQQYYIYPYSF
nr:immunoglobulin light chain junction region [Macaca mulatta]